jgi:hypothetical protein
MAAKPVACVGDASATAGTTPSTKADSGTWTAGPVSVTTDPHLTVGGLAVLAQASCTFSFSGTKGMNPVTDSSTVTLSPSSTVLTYNGGALLRDQDSAQDTYNNTVSVSSSRILASE